MDLASGTRLDFLDALRQVLRNRSTGSIYLKVDDNRAALFSVRAGQIVGLRFGPLTGRRALELFKLTRQMSWRMEEGAVAMVHADLGDSEETLHELAGGEAVVDPGGAQDLLPDTAYEALEKALVQYTGPVAAMILADAVARQGAIRSPADCRRLIAALAAEIGADDETAEFAAKARQILRLAD